MIQLGSILELRLLVQLYFGKELLNNEESIMIAKKTSGATIVSASLGVRSGILGKLAGIDSSDMKCCFTSCTRCGSSNNNQQHSLKK
jgi:hypothetical protein